MEYIEELVNTLRGKDNTAAYQALLSLTDESEHSPAVYPFMDQFIEMLHDKNSYMRSRGLILISANARWDAGHKIDGILDDYVAHSLDEKPITARQCIRALPAIAKHQPHLAGRIREALRKADVSIYKETMRGLVERDIASALEEIG